MSSPDCFRNNLSESHLDREEVSLRMTARSVSPDDPALQDPPTQDRAGGKQEMGLGRASLRPTVISPLGAQPA